MSRGKWVGVVDNTVTLKVPTIARVIELVPDVANESVSDFVHKVTHLNFSVSRVLLGDITHLAWVCWLGRYAVTTATPV